MTARYGGLVTTWESGPAPRPDAPVDDVVERLIWTVRGQTARWMLEWARADEARRRREDEEPPG
jgi:hypothetical protein